MNEIKKKYGDILEKSMIYKMLIKTYDEIVSQMITQLNKIIK
jgi:hypothetical protein